MFKTDHKRAQAAAKNVAGQAATELAVFGAILIFLIGTIVRSAVDSSYTQDNNFKAMRMAMLASWQDSKKRPGMGRDEITAHNSASVFFVEDRLSPDASKYGDLDRNPVIAQGSGTFSYNLLYPLSNAKDRKLGVPIADWYINGQHFPFTSAAYVAQKAIKRPQLSECQALPANSCQANQCFRNYREWAGGTLKESAFISPKVAPTAVTSPSCLTSAYSAGAQQRECQEQLNACTIFTALKNANFFSPESVTSGSYCPAGDAAQISTGITSPFSSSSQWNLFVNATQAANNFNGYLASFPNSTKAQQLQNKKYLQNILTILEGVHVKYKLFYYMEVNGAVSKFTLTAPSCPTHPCKDKELSSDVPLLDYYGNPTTDGYPGTIGTTGSGNAVNRNAVMQFDLLRNANYYNLNNPADPASVLVQFPLSGCPDCMRNYVAWQWAATAGTDASMIRLNVQQNLYPSYDIDGRLKEVVIYNISHEDNADGTKTTYVDYEDPQLGDIDSTWDTNTCAPKPGLQPSSQAYTLTQDGTYLQINEGKLYNPESGQVVRSVSKRDNIDLVQRNIQLSSNTGRFCTNDPGISPPKLCSGADCASPNPVEVCVDESPCNCFMGSTANGPVNPACGNTFAQTCYDTKLNEIFVRSRLEDRRGHFWMTNTSGQLKVQ